VKKRAQWFPGERGSSGAQKKGQPAIFSVSRKDSKKKPQRRSLLIKRGAFFLPLSPEKVGGGALFRMKEGQGTNAAPATFVRGTGGVRTSYSHLL